VAAKPIYPMLVIDAGNTSVKFARVARRHATPRVLATVPTALLTPARVKSVARRSACQTATASCVVPNAVKALRAGCPSLLLIGPSTRLNFATDVDRRTIGADRLANMAEAARRFGKSAIVADFGTAATFDRLDSGGAHAGGAIAPGLRVMAKTLSAETAQLPVTEFAFPRRAAGRNTREALRSGAVGGYAGLVRHLLRALAADHVVLTGGDAKLVAKLIGGKSKSDPLWTLRGIGVLGEFNTRESSK